jgi:hypothetical protein
MRTNSGLVLPIAPARAAHGSLAGAVHREVGDFANLASGFEISAGASAASGHSGSETLSGRAQEMPITMAGPRAGWGSRRLWGEGRSPGCLILAGVYPGHVRSAQTAQREKKENQQNSAVSNLD